MSEVLRKETNDHYYPEIMELGGKDIRKREENYECLNVWGIRKVRGFIRRGRGV